MFARRLLRLAPVRDPFKVLGLQRSASKAEVKAKYRELARVHHPDAESGDSSKMEEVNNAYKLLMKEGGYERLHLRSGGVGTNRKGGVRGKTPGERPTGVTAEGRRKRKDGVPFTSDQEHGGEGTDFAYDDAPLEGSSGLTDEEVEKMSALDPSTERHSPTGTYMYQNRDDGSWVELERPLLKAHQPRYASFKAKVDMNEELRRRAVAREKEQNEKSAFQRTADRLTDSADLPTRNPRLLKLYLVVLAITVYFMYQRTFARGQHQGGRTQWYKEMEKRREDMETVYRNNRDGFEVTVVAATLIYLAAAQSKRITDPVQAPLPEVYYHSVKPPPEHFNVVSGM